MKKTVHSRALDLPSFGHTSFSAIKKAFFLSNLTSLRSPTIKGKDTGRKNGRYTASLCCSGKVSCANMLGSENAVSAACSQSSIINHIRWSSRVATSSPRKIISMLHVDDGRLMCEGNAAHLPSRLAGGSSTTKVCSAACRCSGQIGQGAVNLQAHHRFTVFRGEP